MITNRSIANALIAQVDANGDFWIDAETCVTKEAFQKALDDFLATNGEKPVQGSDGLDSLPPKIGISFGFAIEGPAKKARVVATSLAPSTPRT